MGINAGIVKLQSYNPVEALRVRWTMAKKWIRVGGVLALLLCISAHGLAQSTKARTFNGTSDILTSALTVTLIGASSATYFLGDFNDTTTTADSIAWDHGFASGQGSRMLVKWSGDNTKDLLYWTSAGGSYIVSFARPLTGTPHRYQITITPSGSRAGQLEGIFQPYVDGSLVPVTKIADSSPNTLFTTATLFIGGDTASFVAGQFSMIALWASVPAILGNCGDPTSLSPDFYWPINQTSPETPSAGAINLNVTGTTNSSSQCAGTGSAHSVLLTRVGH